MRVVGIIFIVLGLMLSLTIIGAWLGIPLMIVGAIMTMSRSKPTVITNIVQVAAQPDSGNAVQMTREGASPYVQPQGTAPQSIGAEAQRELPPS